MKICHCCARCCGSSFHLAQQQGRVRLQSHECNKFCQGGDKVVCAVTNIRMFSLNVRILSLRKSCSMLALWVLSCFQCLVIITGILTCSKITSLLSIWWHGFSLTELLQLSYTGKLMCQVLHGVNVVSAGKKCTFGSSSVALIFHAFGFSSLRSQCFLHSELFILVMQRGGGPDQIKSSCCLCCSHSHCSWRIWSAFECAGVWLFWSVSANRGCSWQGCLWVIASKHWEEVLYCIAGHETAYFHPPPPCSTLSLWQLICSNRSGLCYLTWLTSHCKYNHSLPQLSRNVWRVLVRFCIPGCCC